MNSWCIVPNLVKVTANYSTSNSLSSLIQAIEVHGDDTTGDTSIFLFGIAVAILSGGGNGRILVQEILTFDKASNTLCLVGRQGK
jgi:hypothetical protein